MLDGSFCIVGVTCPINVCLGLSCTLPHNVRPNQNSYGHATMPSCRHDPVSCLSPLAASCATDPGLVGAGRGALEEGTPWLGAMLNESMRFKPVGPVVIRQVGLPRGLVDT